MATFKVGQRVRIVRAAGRQYLVGQEASIYCFGCPRGYTFDWPSDTITLTLLDGSLMGCAEHNIEPLQPERNRVVAWEDCPFDPRKIAELV